MRLSEVLNRAPVLLVLWVENFLGTRRVSWGRSKKITGGKVAHIFSSWTCGDLRTFLSGDNPSYLVTGDQLVSIAGAEVIS